MTPHKHCELIKAWADGHEIQVKHPVDGWCDCTPAWSLALEYRIKPRTVKREGWVNIYDLHGRICSVYPDKTEAELNAGPQVIATVKLEWEEEVE